MSSYTLRPPVTDVCFGAAPVVVGMAQHLPGWALSKCKIRQERHRPHNHHRDREPDTIVPHTLPSLTAFPASASIRKVRGSDTGLALDRGRAN